MTKYAQPIQEVPVTLTATELKALREAASALGYHLPGLTSAEGKLKAALKGVTA